MLKEQREEAIELISDKRVIPRDMPNLLNFLSILNILVILGVRRSGKSTLWVLLLKGEEFAYVNFDDERLRKLTIEDLSGVEEGIYTIYGNPILPEILRGNITFSGTLSGYGCYIVL
uniref:AAA family ATPase n=1 Tax=Metallosphaera hakonensis TaxID=79601 RepID=UPI000AB72D1A